VSTIVGEIAGASAEQASGLVEVNSAISQMDEMTQQNAAMVAENTAASRSLASEAAQLIELISFFKMDQQKRAPAAAAVPTAPPAKAVEKSAPAPAAKPAARIAIADDSHDDWSEF